MSTTICRSRTGAAGLPRRCAILDHTKSIGKKRSTSARIVLALAPLAAWGAEADLEDDVHELVAFDAQHRKDT